MFFIRVFLFFLILFGVGVKGEVLASSKILRNQESPKEVAEMLVKSNDTDLKKAKKIAEFIATYFERDGFLEKEKFNSVKKNKVFEKPYKNDFFKTKVGDSFDFAKLYKEMCQAVGLEAVVIEGYAGQNIKSFNVVRAEQKAIHQGIDMMMGKIDSSLERYASAWNGVKIKDKWILVDTYWMIKGEKVAYKNVSSVRQMERILEQNKKRPFKRKNVGFDTRYFDATPREMIKTHFPYDAEWQLLRRPVPLQEFVNN